MLPDLTIVVVTFNSAQVVSDLLDTIPSALGDVTAQTIVVDNGSSDGTPELLETRGDCRVIRSTNIGYAAGINLGVRESPRTPALLVLNPDVRLGSWSVPPMMAALRHPSTGIVAPQIRSEDGSLFPSLRREPSLARAMGLNHTGRPFFSEYVARPEEYLEARHVDWALGAVLLISRECFDALGGWDESYFLYSEETDFSLRARDAGYLTRYEPRSVATHLGGGSGRTAKTHAMQIVNRVRLYRRRNGVVASLLYYGLHVLSELSWIARSRPESRAAVVALLRPSRRPSELGCSDRLLPT